MAHHRSNQTLPSCIEFENQSDIAPEEHKTVRTLERPCLKDENANATQTKRAKLSTSGRASSKDKKKPSQKDESVKEKRQRKIETKEKSSNKGLIGSAMTLSVVGMLNFMGSTEMAACTTSLDGEKREADELRFAGQSYGSQVLDTEDILSEANFGSCDENSYINDWVNLDNEEIDDLEPSFNDYGFTGELAPAKIEQVVMPNGILNKTNTGMTLEEAYVAYDLRESYLQRHMSPLAA